MRKTLLVLFGAGLLFVSSLATGSPAAARKDPDNTRALSGRVVSPQNEPVSKAIVYLKNTKSLVVKTYITDPDGGYRFPGLSPNVDYEIYAEHDGARSDTKTLSQFDDRKQVSITLRIR